MRAETAETAGTVTAEPTKLVTRGAHTFETWEYGPAGGELVLLLHGFPQHASCWDLVVPLLTAQGYRVVTMNQRGYTPGAQPPRRRDFKLDDLAADAVAVIDAYGGAAHVVGHDWGAAVAWGLGMNHPAKVSSLTAVSVPHPQAFLKSMLTSRQCLASWYMVYFQLPWLPERGTRATWPRFLGRFGGQSPAVVRRDRGAFASPQSLTGPINWYRALPFTNVMGAAVRVPGPTLFVWSDRDVFLLRKGAETCGRYVDGPYTYVVLPGVSHWVPDEAPGALADAVLAHLQRNPARAPASA